MHFITTESKLCKNICFSNPVSLKIYCMRIYCDINVIYQTLNLSVLALFVSFFFLLRNFFTIDGYKETFFIFSFATISLTASCKVDVSCMVYGMYLNVFSINVHIRSFFICPNINLVSLSSIKLL